MTYRVTISFIDPNGREDVEVLYLEENEVQETITEAPAACRVSVRVEVLTDV